MAKNKTIESKKNNEELEIVPEVESTVESIEEIIEVQEEAIEPEVIEPEVIEPTIEPTIEPEVIEPTIEPEVIEPILEKETEFPAVEEVIEPENKPLTYFQLKNFRRNGR